MKNILLFLFFNVIFLNAQTYNFNYLIAYSVQEDHCNTEISMYVNSDNPNYYLKLSRSQDKSYASLKDYKAKKIHSYQIKETKQKGDVLFEFVYLNSVDFNIYNTIPDLGYEYSVSADSANISGDSEALILKTFKNKKRKKVDANFVLEVKKSANLFPAFEFCCVHPHQFAKKDRPNNLLVLSAVETSKKGYVTNYKLTTLKEVVFELVVPNQSKEVGN